MCVVMRRAMFFVVIMFAACMPSLAQEEMEAIMRVTGADAPEEMDEYEVERLSAMIRRPVRLNSVSTSRLASCGLFSAYQAASFIDYMTRHGDVVSYAELSSIDGFGEDFVEKIKPFVTLEGGEIDESKGRGIWNDMTIKTGLKSTAEELSWNYGVRYSMESSGGVSAGVAFSRPYSASGPAPDSYSGVLEWEFMKIPMRILAGDYNARFGQGLALWNGLSMSGLTSPSSFMRRPSGLSGSSSFTGSYAMTGLALSAFVRKLVLNVSLALPGIHSMQLSPEGLSMLPAVNLVWNHRNGQIGMTHYMDSRLRTGEISDMKSSVDFAWCVRGVDIFGEAVFDWVYQIPAALAGVSFPLGESFRSAAMIRLYPSGYSSEWSGAQRSTTSCSNEFSASAALEYAGNDRRHTAGISADMAFFPEPKNKDCSNNRQIKLQASWEFAGDRVGVKVRMKERVRDWGRKYQTDLRSDIIWRWKRMALNVRANLLHCRALAGLGYVEGDYKTDKIGVYIKSGIFIVDNWDDRIYAYERDGPGNFNVPAFYGRGTWVSAVASLKFARWGKLYVRSAYTGYPFMTGEKKKPGKAELKLQCVFSF